MSSAFMPPPQVEIRDRNCRQFCRTEGLTSMRAQQIEKAYINIVRVSRLAEYVEVVHQCFRTRLRVVDIGRQVHEELIFLLYLS